MQLLCKRTWKQLSFSSEEIDWRHWAGWICHTGKQVFRPIPCHWNVLPAVTSFLREIFANALVINICLAIFLCTTILFLCTKKASVLCVHLLTKLLKQAWVKGVCLDVVNNFNDINQYTVKFWWHFSASQHFPVNDTMRRLTIRCNLLNPSC